MHRPGHNLSARLDHDGVSGVYPFIRIRVQLRFAGNVFRNVAGAKRHATSHDPASTLACNVLERADPIVAGIIGRRDVNLDAKRVERKSSKRHIAFPADERTDPAASRVDHFEPRSIAESPY